MANHERVRVPTRWRRKEPGAPCYTRRMRRSVQEIVELLVFGLIALLVGTALLWVVGWTLDLVGVLLKFFAGLIWSLLRFIIPVAVVAAIVYALVRLIQQQREGARAEPAESAAPTHPTAPTDPTPPTDPITPTDPTTPIPPTPPTPPAPPTTPGPISSAADEDSQEGAAPETSQPHSSEVWVPPQPSPPAGDPDHDWKVGQQVPPENDAVIDEEAEVLPEEEADGEHRS